MGPLVPFFIDHQGNDGNVNPKIGFNKFMNEEMLTKIMSTKEDLVPALVDYLEEGTVYKMLRHPLVYAVPYTESMNAYYNLVYKTKHEAAQKLLRERNLLAYLMCFENPHKLTALHDYVVNYDVDDNKLYWEAVLNTWISVDNSYQNREEWLELWTMEDKGSPLQIMSEEEVEQFAALPETITIYRGFMYMEGLQGLSWSLDFDQATWFAKRYGKGIPRVACAEIKKSDVLFLVDSSEREVIVHPEHIVVKEIKEI